MSITGTGVRQDEPMDGLGDGDTSPDAMLVPLQVRAERAGCTRPAPYPPGTVSTLRESVLPAAAVTPTSALAFSPREPRVLPAAHGAPPASEPHPAPALPGAP